MKCMFFLALYTALLLYSQIERKQHDSDEWNFIRIAHLDLSASSDKVDMGLFACAPQDGGGNTVFDYLQFSKTEGFHHTN